MALSQWLKEGISAMPVRGEPCGVIVPLRPWSLGLDESRCASKSADESPTMSESGPPGLKAHSRKYPIDGAFSFAQSGRRDLFDHNHVDFND